MSKEVEDTPQIEIETPEAETKTETQPEPQPEAPPEPDELERLRHLVLRNARNEGTLDDMNDLLEAAGMSQEERSQVIRSIVESTTAYSEDDEFPLDDDDDEVEEEMDEPGDEPMTKEIKERVDRIEKGTQEKALRESIETLESAALAAFNQDEKIKRVLSDQEIGEIARNTLMRAFRSAVGESVKRAGLTFDSTKGQLEKVARDVAAKVMSTEGKLLARQIPSAGPSDAPQGKVETKVQRKKFDKAPSINSPEYKEYLGTVLEDALASSELGADNEV